MTSETLGQAIRRFRQAAGFTLRAFAAEIEISAAHQSDIEHGRRMPSEKVLKDVVKKLAKVGATFEVLQALDARLHPDLDQWVKETPEVGQMLRHMRASNRSPTDILRELRSLLQKEKEDKKP